MKVKLCLTRLLRQYTILTSEKTEQEFNIRVIAPNAVYIKLHQRK
jgi:hypothetical protein